MPLRSAASHGSDRCACRGRAGSGARDGSCATASHCPATAGQAGHCPGKAAPEDRGRWQCRARSPRPHTRAADCRNSWRRRWQRQAGQPEPFRPEVRLMVRPDQGVPARSSGLGNRLARYERRARDRISLHRKHRLARRACPRSTAEPDGAVEVGACRQVDDVRQGLDLDFQSGGRRRARRGNSQLTANVGMTVTFRALRRDGARADAVAACTASQAGPRSAM